jgi:hypothetical protein
MTATSNTVEHQERLNTRWNAEALQSTKRIKNSRSQSVTVSLSSVCRRRFGFGF